MMCIASSGRRMTTADGSHAESVFARKDVMVVSPQPWSHIMVSKHHYAREVARIANRVFFLNPPESANSTSVRQSEVAENLFIVSHGLGFPSGLRFHLRGVFDYLMRRHVRKLIAATGLPDILWCFDCNLYSDLRMFRAGYRIYHPVDPIPYEHQLRPAESADLVLSVSESILGRLTPRSENAHVVNHGLSPVYARSQTPAESLTDEERPLRFGYFGNLTRPQIDHCAVSMIIEAHPDVEFHFWGPTEPVDAASAVGAFLETLRRATNVKLHGSVTPEELAIQIRTQDGFLLAYNVDGVMTDNSNSHKILEYLSTGKVIVSKPISYYAESQLIEMSADASPAAFAMNFDRIKREIATFNSPDRQAARIAYALENTYSHQIERIAGMIQANQGEQPQGSKR